MPPEEEKKRALGREQQTRRWIRCSLPGWVSHEFPASPGVALGVLGGSRGGNGGELVVRGLAHSGVFILLPQLVLPLLPSQARPGCRSGTAAAQRQTGSPPATTAARQTVKGAG